MNEIAFMVRTKIGNIKRGCLQRKLHCRLHSTQFAQEDGFEMTSFIIMNIARKRSLNEFQRICIPVLCARNLSEGEVASILPGSRPDGFIESVSSFIETSL